MSDTVLSFGSASSHKIVKPSKKTIVGIAFKNEEDGGISVAKIRDNGLAARSGIRVGDRVQEINGVSMENKSSSDAANLIRESHGDVIITAMSVEEIFSEMEVEEDVTEKGNKWFPDEAALSSFPLGFVVVVLQVVAAYVIFTYFDYGSVGDFTTQQYIIYRDIMVMLLLGFGYLMTFLEKYGLGAVGFTMLLTVLNMECNLLMEGYFTNNFTISMDSIINAEFSAAALLISFGALIGRASPLMMVMISIVEALFYAINKVYIVFGHINAEDVGGTITIHMFGAYFGLACASTLGPLKKEFASNNSASRVSDVFSLIGTTLLWVYWPSFVGATETGVPANEMHCLNNTIMALIGSTGATFLLSQYLNEGKFDAVHVQNSTLAGGVAIGATARLAMGPGMAFLVGSLAGLVSVLGYFYSSPFLEAKYNIFDTCGVGNLHGYPSVLGGLLSILLVYLNSDAEFLNYAVGSQSLMQLSAVVATLAVSIVTGLVSGLMFLRSGNYFDDVPDYDDAVWWTDVE